MCKNMGSTEDPRALRARNNPKRTCRAVYEFSVTFNKANPETGATNGHLFSESKNVESVVPPQATAGHRKALKKPCKGRRKKDFETEPTQDKGNVDVSSNLFTNREDSNRMDSCPIAISCGKSNSDSDQVPQRKAKMIRTCVQDSKKSKLDQIPAETSTANTLRPPSPTSPSNSCLRPELNTPKSSRHHRQRISPRLTSTPVGARNLHQVPSTTDGTMSSKISRTNGHEHPNISPVKTSLQDVTTQKRVRLRKPRAQVNPATQEKERVRKRLEKDLKKKEKKQNEAPPPKFRRKKKDVTTKVERIRPRFELDDTDLHDSRNQDPDQTLSSDLSIELSLQEDPDPLKHSLSLQEEEEDDEEEEELPSFLQQDNHKPSSIREGLCVWCKLRKYPYWPAVVKSVNHKTKKASIVFVDKQLLDKKSIKKGLTVSLRSLKPFDCKEAETFVDIGKEQYGAYFTWCLAVLSDYRIRIACGFVGTFIDYFTTDISSPVRNEYPVVLSNLIFPSQALLNEQEDSSCDTTDQLQEDEQTDKLSDRRCLKKLLPDRTQAARNRANEKLVEFIVKKRGAENRLMAVINGQESSKWLQAMHSSSRTMVGVYLEDDEQTDKVYQYLQNICDGAAKSCAVLENTDRIRFIMDVLLPEAIIYAIAGVDHLSLEKAEEKFRQGPRHSNRERQEFDMMIEQQMKSKANPPRQML